jgi:hypothetical protein
MKEITQIKNRRIQTFITVLLVMTLLFANGTAVSYAASADTTDTDTATMLLVSWAFSAWTAAGATIYRGR